MSLIYFIIIYNVLYLLIKTSVYYHYMYECKLSIHVHVVTVVVELYVFFCFDDLG